MGDLPIDDPIARGELEDVSQWVGEDIEAEIRRQAKPTRGESKVHKLAKSMMLRDLRGHLDDWEEGKWTLLDLEDVEREIHLIFSHWKDYQNWAIKELTPRQLHSSQMRAQYK